MGFLTFVRAGFVTIRAKLTASALALALIGASYPAMAGGLGRMHVQSGLGQPFRAEIDITGVRSQELNQIRVNIASPAAFAEMQMDYPDTLQGATVTLARKPDGKLVARVQGAQPINDPFLFLLLELNDGGARSFKEFTALLEPSDKPAPAVPAVSAEQAKPAASAAPPTPAAPSTTPAPQAPANAAKPADNKPAKPDADGPLPNDGRQHTVKPGETLSGVAAKLKPADVTLEQMMVGLYRNNSGAFAGDMNKLRAGAQLDVPAADGVRAIPPRDALDTVRAQVKDWRNYVLGGADAAAAAPARDPGKTRTPPSDASAEVAPQDNKDGVLKLSKAESKPGEERTGQLEEELVSREKALKDANERITTLEAQLEEMRGLLALRSQMGAEAEKQAQEAKQAEAQAAKADKPPKKPVAQGNSDSQSNVMFLLGGLGLAGALLAGVLYAHRRKDTFRRWWAQLMAGRRKKAEEKAAEKAAKADRLAASTETAPAAAATDSNDEDPLVVADRLIEYNKLAQAETVLLEALNKTPDRHELRLKLLKVYYAMPLVDKFNAQAARLLDAVSKTSPLWVQALEMGRKLDPNHPLYAAPKPVEPVTSDDFGFDEADIEPAPAPAPAPAPKPAAKPAPASVAEDPFDLDGDLLPDDAVMQGGGSFVQDPSDDELEEKPLLDYDFQIDKDKKSASDAAPAAPAKPAAPAASDSLSMDDVFDFGLDAPAEPAPAPAAAKPAAPAPAPAPIADPVADTLSQDDLDDLFAQPAPAPAAKPEPAPVNDVLSQDDLDNLFGETPAAAEPAADDGELDIDALIAAEQAKQAEEEAQAAAKPAPSKPSKPAIPSGEELSLDFDGIFEDTVPPLPALDPEALAAALANAPDMDDLPPPDDTVLEASDMPLEIPDEGALAAELAEPEPQEGDNPLQDEMSEPSPLLTGDMANIDPDLAFDFDAVFQDAAPAAPKLDRSALAAALASAPDLEDLHEEETAAADNGEAVTPEQVETKLDLARVYIDMGDEEGAREILVEVMAEGTDEQRDTALKLMEKL